MDRPATKALASATSSQVLRTVSYDYSGALLTKVRENGTGIARTNYLAYDNARRLRKKDTPEGVLAYSYRTNGAVGTLKAYGRTAVSVNAEPAGSATTDLNLGYGYDALGRLSTVTNFFGGTSVSQYYYDAAGNTLSVVYPQTSRMTNTYDARNRLAAIEIGKTDGTLIRRFENSYSMNSLRTGVVEKKAGTSGSVLQRRKVDYGYDAGVPEVVPTATGTTTVTMRPARLNRLTHESIIEGSGATYTGTETFLYDALGNRRKGAASGVSNVSAAASEFNLLDQPIASYTFDANGNTLTSPGAATGTSGSGTTNTDTYDTENRLVQRVTSTNTVTMGYDPAGNRVWKDVYQNGSHLSTYYLVDELNPTGYPQVVAEYTSTTPQAPAYSQIYMTFEYGKQLISFRQPVYSNGSYIGSYVRHQGLDTHGSMRLLMASTGNLDVGCEYDYDAYGNLINTPSTILDVQMRFAGEQWDKDLGLVYNRARYYDPRTGRFWNRDTFEGNSGNPVSLHKYLYCHNDPINWQDPNGHLESADVVLAMGIALNIATLAYDAISYSNHSRKGNSVEAGTDLVNVAVDIALLAVPFSGPGSTFARATGPAIARATSIARASGGRAQIMWAGLRGIVRFAQNNFDDSGSGPESSPEPGQWQDVNESMSPEARAYQESVTGHSHQAYVVNGTKFDGFTGKILQEAKAGYRQFLNAKGQFAAWFEDGAEALVEQAKRQRNAARGTKIEWHVKEKEAADAMRDLLQRKGVTEIDVIYTPKP